MLVVNIVHTLMETTPTSVIVILDTRVGFLALVALGNLGRCFALMSCG